MNNRLTLQDLAGILAKQTGRTKKEAEEFLREFISIVSDGVFADKIAKIKGLGTFKIIEVEDRESINVNTGNRFVIPGHYKFTFTPDKDLKELVNKPFSFFDTTEINSETDFPELESSNENEDSEEDNIEEITPQIVSPEPEIPEEKAEDIQEEIQDEPIEPIIDSSVEEKIVSTEPKAESKTLDPIDKAPEKKKSNKAIWISLVILLIIAIGGGVYYFINSISQPNIPVYADEPQELEIEEPIIDIVEDTAVVQTEEVTDTIQAEQLEGKPSQTTVNKPEDLDRVKIEPGSRLTLIAQKYYNHKIFWVYLYEYNKARISDPNNIPIGTEILVPAPELYGINAQDRASIEKASALQTQILTGGN